MAAGRYEGERLPIVNRELFDQVQLMLKSNSVERNSAADAKRRAADWQVI